MTPAEAATHARVSERTLVRADDRGELQSCRINGNGRRRYRQAWVDAWISGGSALLLLLLMWLAMMVAGCVCGSDSVCDVLRLLGINVRSHG